MKPLLLHHWSWPGWVRVLARGAADFLYPPACRLCQGELPEVEVPPTGTGTASDPISPSSGAGASACFCAACRSKLLETRGPACLKCGASIGPYLDPHALCSFCRNENFAFERVFRLGVYDTALRTACQRAKADLSEPLVAGLADLLWDCEAGGLEGFGVDVVMPVPHHWWKRFYAPHNAAETVAAVLARRLQVPLAPHILRKIRWTRAQRHLPPSERRRNLRNAFRAQADPDLSGACVLLADDVMTTGTTVQEITKVLLQAGAARVAVAVIARALGRH